MVKLAEIFTDHMVLQRDKEIRFFGTAQGEDEVTVNFCGEQCQAILRDECWALLRKEQEIASDETDHMDMAVLIDCGDEGDIHPLDKKKPGERMALHCMQVVYKNTEIKPEPRFSEAVRSKNGHILIRFKGGNGNLRADTQGSNKNLEAVGQDGIFYPAEYNICGCEIEVWCKQTERIQFVRYAFHNCVKVDLFDEAGLPVAPFFIEI